MKIKTKGISKKISELKPGAVFERDNTTCMLLCSFAKSLGHDECLLLSFASYHTFIGLLKWEVNYFEGATLELGK